MHKTIFLLIILLLGSLIYINISLANEKVLICHKTHSQKNQYVLIEINKSAEEAHIQHGDFYPINNNCKEIPSPIPM